MRVLGYIALFFCVPFFAHAQIRITEIMYDPVAPESDNEWVELCNTGNESVDLAQWYIFESNKARAFETYSENTNIDPQSCGIVARSANAVEGYDGALFLSTFSLSNSGETILLKDGNDVVQDEVSYDPAQGGSEQNGETLHRDGELFVSGTPTPGTSTQVSFSSEANESSDASHTNSASVDEVTSSTLYSYESVTIQPPQDIHIRVPETLITTVGASTIFELESYDATGKATHEGVVEWAFGDGGSAIGRKVGHRFWYEGEYTTTVVLRDGSLFDRKDISVTVVPLRIVLYVDQSGEWVAIHNTGSYPLDISQWRLVVSGQYFSIPDNTIIAADNEVRFPTMLTKLTMLRGNSGVSLVFPDGTVAAQGTDTEPENTQETAEAENTQNNESVFIEQNKKAVHTTYMPIALPVEDISKPSLIMQDVQLENERTNTPATTSTYSREREAAAVLLAQPQSVTNWYWYVGLGALLLLAAVTTLLLRTQSQSLVVDGFEVVEEDDS